VAPTGGAPPYYGAQQRADEDARTAGLLADDDVSFDKKRRERLERRLLGLG
jgi:hypothetical protein